MAACSPSCGLRSRVGIAGRVESCKIGHREFLSGKAVNAVGVAVAAEGVLGAASGKVASCCL